MNETEYNQSYFDSTDSYRKYIGRTFLHLAVGLLVTALTGFLVLLNVVNYGVFYQFLMSGWGVWVLFIAELGLVAAIGAGLSNFSLSTVTAMFYLYAVVNGIEFSLLPLAYGFAYVFLAFLFAGVFFGCMAFIGYRSTKDMSGWRPYLTAGLISLIILTIVSIFLRLEALDMVINYVGLGIFIAITAYDMQKIRNIYQTHFAQEGEMAEKFSVYSALTLYLDFINIFLYVLRILGRRDRN